MHIEIRLTINITLFNLRYFAIVRNYFVMNNKSTMQNLSIIKSVIYRVTLKYKTILQKRSSAKNEVEEYFYVHKS